MKTEDTNERFPNRPDDKAQWWIEGDLLCIPNADGFTILHFTRAHTEGVLRQHDDLIYKVRELEGEVNRRQPDRFLPQLLKKLETNSMTAMAGNDLPRCEAYAACSFMIRRFLSDDAERNKTRY